jgi:transposase-like protein
MSYFNLSGCIKCPRCQSSNIIRKGQRPTKRGQVQLYKCKDCGLKFISDALHHRQASLADLSKIFQWTVDNKTYYEIGLRIGVSPQTVSALIRDYVKLLLRYESSLELKIGGKWQMDDVYHELTSAWTQFYEINPENGHSSMKLPRKIRLRTKNERWILNVFDEDTRYWLAAMASPRNKSAAMKALNSSVKRARRFPERIKGDDFSTYPLACNAILPTSVVRDFKSKKEAYGHVNEVERLNRTLRKSLPADKRRFRCLSALQDFVEIVRFHYNYIRSHKGLNNKTPAEIAGVISLSEDRWQNLVNLAYANSSRLEKIHEPNSLIANFEHNVKLSRQTSIINPCWQWPAA